MPPGAYGCEVRFILPMGEQAHGAYSVSTMDLVPPASPDSDLMVRPRPSKVDLVQRPLVVAVWVPGELV